MYGLLAFIGRPALWRRLGKVKHFVIPHEMLCEASIWVSMPVNALKATFMVPSLTVVFFVFFCLSGRAAGISLSQPLLPNEQRAAAVVSRLLTSSNQQTCCWTHLSLA